MVVSLLPFMLAVLGGKQCHTLLFALAVSRWNRNNHAHFTPMTPAVSGGKWVMVLSCIPFVLAVSWGKANNGPQQHLPPQRKFQHFHCHLAVRFNPSNSWFVVVLPGAGKYAQIRLSAIHPLYRPFTGSVTSSITMYQSCLWIFVWAFYPLYRRLTQVSVLPQDRLLCVKL